MGLVCKVTIGIVGAGLFITCLLRSSMTFETTAVPYMEMKETSSTLDEQRSKSITFLLGEDKPGYQYFKLAEEHFLFDEMEKTDVLVKSCRSLEDMIVFLNNNKNTRQWHTIQVVLHGNPYNGLSLPIVNEGPRATPKNLIKAVLEAPTPKLRTNAVDSTTQINFWACGIGKNPFINIALDSIFQLPDSDTPKIYTSPHFVIFRQVENGAAPKRLKASYWPYIFKRGYRPSDTQIELELKRQYPDAAVEWSAAINTSEPDDDHPEFQNSFHIPVVWTVTYPSKENRPSVKSEQEKMRWIKSQPELLSQIEALNIPIDKFTWTVHKIIHANKEGEGVPAIKAIGMATVLCILETS